MTVYEARVARGRAMLNARGPADWPERINMDEQGFDVRSSNCILDHVFRDEGGWSRGAAVTFRNGVDDLLGLDSCGFFASTQADADAIHAAWRVVIAEELSERAAQPVGQRLSALAVG